MKRDKRDRPRERSKYAAKVEAQHDAPDPEDAPRFTAGAGRDCRPGAHVPRKRLRAAWPGRQPLKVFARARAADGDPDAQAWCRHKGIKF